MTTSQATVTDPVYAKPSTVVFNSIVTTKTPCLPARKVFNRFNFTPLIVARVTRFVTNAAPTTCQFGEAPKN